MSTTTSEIDDYVTAVHAALADLSDADREDLLEDLPQHLADLQADRGGSLTDLLGTPGAYAAELRATAGLEAPSQAAPWWGPVRRRLAQADARLGAALNYDRLVDLLHALAPGWWLLRGYLVVQVCTRAINRFGSHALIPQVGGSRGGGAVILALACAGSVWLGRRRLSLTWPRIALVAIGLALAGYGVALVHRIDQTATVYSDNGNGDSRGALVPYSSVQNVYPVGPDGSVLKDVRLYDQDGNPITLGARCTVSGATVYGSGGEIFTVRGIPQPTQGATSAPAYPLTCPVNEGPFPSGTASALPATSSPAPSATPSAASPSPSATPTG